MKETENKTFEFARQLIEAERYKNYKKDFWGGADVIFASTVRLDKEEKNKVSLREQLKEWQDESHLLVETDHASAVVWLIETLKPYIDIDYLSKYEYYRNLGECVIRNKSINNEKDLLFTILEEPEVNKWEKKNNDSYSNSISKFRWEEWYDYGVENNDPFFVKFMTLWVAFNQIYSKFSGEEKKPKSERVQIMKCLEKDEEDKLLTKELFDSIFASPFIKVFKDDSVCSYDRLEKKFIPDSFENNKTVKNENEQWQERIKALFMMIYQVRCNLFHGSKEVSNPRDVKLVKCAGEILEMYLEGTSNRPFMEYNMVTKEN